MLALEKPRITWLEYFSIAIAGIAAVVAFSAMTVGFCVWMGW